MPSVYLDTTVYDRIAKREIDSADVDALRRAIARRRLKVYLGLSTLEELLGQWETGRHEAVRRVQLARDLVGFDLLLKPSAELLGEDIRAYAKGAPTPPATISQASRRHLVSRLEQQIARGERGLDSEVTSLIADVHRRKGRFREDARQAQGRVREYLRHQGVSAGDLQTLTWQDFFSQNLIPWTKAVVVTAPPGDGEALLQACERRGLDGLVARRSVRVCVGAMLSLAYAQDGPGGRLARHSDGYDLWHAAAASVVDIFVTDDGPFRKQLERVPVDALRVISSRELLEDLRSSPGR